MNIKNNNFICVILAGGLSKRFGGKTKTFGKINGITIFEKIIRILKKQNTKILINTNIDKEKFSENNIEIISDIDNKFQGPLSGILATMLWIKKHHSNIEWIMSVPSDTPFLPINLLNSFKLKIKNENNILIARSNGKIHPVVGLWNINLLDKLKKELKSDNRKIMNWVSKNKYDFVDFPVHDYDPFFNINTKEDLIEAERIEKISHLS